MNRNKATSFSENLIEIQVQKLFFGGGGEIIFLGEISRLKFRGLILGGEGARGVVYFRNLR